MAPKKKAPRLSRAERAALVIDRWAKMENDLADAHKKIAELTEQLGAKDKELEGAYRNAAGVSATIDFLWGEIDRYRNRLMDHISWDAMLPDDLRKAVQKVRTEAYVWEHDEDEKP
jgi:ABC-type transporter Mla subunit MlaD